MFPSAFIKEEKGFDEPHVFLLIIQVILFIIIVSVKTAFFSEQGTKLLINENIFQFAVDPKNT